MMCDYIHPSELLPRVQQGCSHPSEMSPLFHFQETRSLRPKCAGGISLCVQEVKIFKMLELRLADRECLLSQMALHLHLEKH